MSCSERITSLDVVPQRLLLLNDVLGHLARAVIEERQHRIAGPTVDFFDRRHKRRGHVERRGRDIVLIGRREIYRHRLVTQFDVLGPENGSVRSGLEYPEEVVLDRHSSM